MLKEEFGMSSTIHRKIRWDYINYIKKDIEGFEKEQVKVIGK